MIDYGVCVRLLKSMLSDLMGFFSFSLLKKLFILKPSEESPEEGAPIDIFDEENKVLEGEENLGLSSYKESHFACLTVKD